MVAPELGLYRALGWTDNLAALGVVHAAFVVPLCTWILKTSFDAIPRDLLEAALVDGCNYWSAMLRM